MSSKPPMRTMAPVFDLSIYLRRRRMGLEAQNHHGQRPRDNDPPTLTNPGLNRKVMRLAYGGSEAQAAIAANYLAEMLDNFAQRLTRQRARGLDYFVGDSLAACDIHWACFSALLEPLPHEVNPMPDWLRLSYAWLGPVLERHNHQILLEHRNTMFERHLGLPLDY